MAREPLDGFETCLRQDSLKGVLKCLNPVMQAVIAFYYCAGLVEAELEWCKLPPEVQDPLSRWAKDRGYRFSEDFLRVLFELETNRDQERWVDEVLGQSDVE